MGNEDFHNDIPLDIAEKKIKRGRPKKGPDLPPLHEQDFYTLLASQAEDDKERLVYSILQQAKSGDSAALKMLEKALLQRQSATIDGRPIVFMPIELMDKEGIDYDVPAASGAEDDSFGSPSV